MREIKIKAFDRHDRKVKEVVSIDFEDKQVFFKGDNGWVGFDNIELMQCSDIPDKNGVEIYDGYILKSANSVIIVSFEDGAFAGRTAPHRETIPLCQIDLSDYEIVGNIYEKIELGGED